MTNMDSAVKTFNLLAEGDTTIKFSPDKNITLVLGKTGSGKSTFVQYIAGDNEQLISKKVGSIYIIEDKQNRIGYGTISKTIFPDLVVDSQTNAVYYDCPGFADNRDVSMDIAATYFIKKVIDDAKFVKIVLTIGYSATEVVNDRGNEFKSFLEHAISLIKNIDKFKNSISLVVTRVRNDFYENDEGIIVPVSDNAIIYSIATFLDRLKPELKDVSPFKDNPKLHADAMVLIDTLLTQKGNVYQKIGIFRSPNKEGPISQIRQLQVGKQHITNMIQENTEFTSKDTEDFGYTISDASKNAIHYLVERLNEQITSSATNIGKEIEQYYRSKVEQSTDIHKLQNDLTYDYNILSKIPELEATSLTPEKLATTIFNGTMALGISISQEILNTLHRSNNYLDLFHVASNQPLGTRPLEWVNPLTDAVKYVHNLVRWYTFLTDLYGKLSTYDIQKDTSKYNVANLEDWGSEGRLQGIQITHGNLRQFFDKLVNIEMRGYNEIKDIEIEESELIALNHILRTTLVQNVHTICLPDKLVVKGNYVSLLQVPLHKCGAIKSIEIYALNTVFFDADYPGEGRKWQLSIIAPKWEVPHLTKLKLDGAPGEKYQARAGSSNIIGGRGRDGKPGLPGGSAGNFLGIGKVFIDSQYLSITANGGSGGPGQDGGDGGRGKTGQTPSEEAGYDNFEKHHISKLVIPAIVYNHIDNNYRIFGKPGGPGGDGGDGGGGGLGGKEGQIKILNVGRTVPNIIINNQKGSLGVGGKGGEGGRRGFNGDNIEVSHHIKMIGAFPIQYSWGSIKKQFPNHSTGMSGSSGIDNHITSQRLQPEEGVKIQNPSHVVNNFKSYLLENLNDSIMKPSLTEFFDLLNNNNQVISLYDTLGYVDEFNTLENQYFKIKYQIEFVPYYQSLSSRISNYVTLLQNNEKSKQHKKVLSYLYTATLSKIYLLKDPESNLIIDIKGYLESATSTINKLPRLSKQVAINTRNEKYKDAINKQIKEANDFIDKQITSELNNIGQEIDEQVELLIIETLDLQESAEAEKQELLKKRNRLQNAVLSRLTLNILTGVGKVVGLTAGWGQEFGIILDRTSMVTESFILDDDVNQRKELKIPQGIKNSLRETEISMHTIGARAALKQKRSLTDGALIADISTDIFLKYKADKRKIDTLNSAIEQAKDTIDQLKQYESKIYSSMIPILNGIRNNINDLESTLNSKSQVALDVAKWKIQSSLRDTKLHMQQFTKEFKVEENLARCMDKLEETMSIMINIYDRIQNYHEQKLLADYIADISSVASNSIAINDVDLSIAINKLELIIKSNIILDQYEIVVNGLKQYIFPFADLYLAEFNWPSSLLLNSSIQDLVFNTVEQIENLQTKLIKTDTSITKHDQYVYMGDFDPRKHNTTKPFFVWENEKYKYSITNLLAGKEVSIKADIMKGVNKNTVKFSSIEIHFKSKSIAIQNELDAILNEFELQITHLGNSYYRCNDNIYVINTDIQSIKYSLAKNSKGEPIFSNDVYMKIKDGNPMLSPYAMWSIKLLNTNNSAFDELTKYSNQVDLELVGRGQYVTDDYICNRKLGNYYKVDDTIGSNYKSDSSRNHHDDDGHFRSIRAINGDDEYVNTNAAAAISAPLHATISWLTDKLVALKVPGPISYIQDWLTAGTEMQKSASNQRYESFSYHDKFAGSSAVDPSSFYRQVDSVLVLAPVIHYLWQKLFCNKVSQNQDITYIDITPSRLKTWRNFLDGAQEIVQLLETEFGSSQSEVREFADVLETRRKDINRMSRQIRVDAQKIEELEANFIAFQVDLQDDVNYNNVFTNIKYNKKFIQAMNKLTKHTEELPEYARKLELVKLNYSHFGKEDEDRTIFSNEIEYVSCLSGAFGNNNVTSAIEHCTGNIDSQQGVD